MCRGARVDDACQDVEPFEIVSRFKLVKVDVELVEVDDMPIVGWINTILIFGIAQ